MCEDLRPQQLKDGTNLIHVGGFWTGGASGPYCCNCFIKEKGGAASKACQNCRARANSQPLTSQVHYSAPQPLTPQVHYSAPQPLTPRRK